MKAKQIVADIYQLLAAGVNTILQAAVLIHVGRVGLQGVTVTELARQLEVSESSVNGVLIALVELKMITRFTRRGARGRAYHYVCSVKGWDVLTRPVDYSLYPDALKAIC